MVPPLGGDSLPNEEHIGPSIAGDGSMVVFIAQDVCSDGCSNIRLLAAYDVASDTVGVLPMGGHTSPADPVVSSDAELVAFSAIGTVGELRHIYLLDRSTGVVDLISSADGEPGTGPSTQPAISSDGRYVAFATEAANILGGPTDDPQIVVRDRANANLDHELVSVTNTVDDDGSTLGNEESFRPAVASNAGGFADPGLPAGLPFVVFSSFASNLGPDDTGGEHNVLVRSFLSARMLDGPPADLGDVALRTTRTRFVDFVASPFGFGPVAGRGATVAGAEFSVGTLDCPTVQPGGTCAVVASYSPTAIGDDEATLDVEYDTNPTFVDDDELAGRFPTAGRRLLASGTASGLVFQPSTMAFGDRLIGADTAPATVSVELRSDPADPADTSAVGFTEVVVSGPGRADYRIVANDCVGPGAVVVGDPCAITVVFRPSAVGSRPAFIEFRSGAGGPTDLVPITGAGIQPRIVLNPAVVHAGGVIGVEGLDWPPGEVVRLSIPSMPTMIDLVVGPDGTIELPTVIFRSRNFGPREVMAEVVDDPSIRLAQPVILLVEAPGANVVDIIGRY
jgi:hypothetical protein